MYACSRSVMAASKSLTPAERENILSSWALWEKNLKQNGSSFFLAFFEAHVEYKNVFRIFRDLDLKDLKDSPVLKSHASVLMRSLSSILDNLDDEPCMKEVLVKLSKSHYPRGVRIKHFQDLFEIFKKAMTSTLGDQFTPEAAKAWESLITYILVALEKDLADRKKIETGR